MEDFNTWRDQNRYLALQKTVYKCICNGKEVNLGTSIAGMFCSLVAAMAIGMVADPEGFYIMEYEMPKYPASSITFLTLKEKVLPYQIADGTFSIFKRYVPRIEYGAYLEPLRKEIEYIVRGGAGNAGK